MVVSQLPLHQWPDQSLATDNNLKAQPDYFDRVDFFKKSIYKVYSLKINNF